MPYFKQQSINSSAQSPAQERMNSPININNYINIYTSKSPPKKAPISFTAPGFIGNTTPVRKSGGNPFPAPTNASYLKNMVNNSGNREYHNQYGTTSLGGSLERAKFSSLDKPIGSTSHAGSTGHSGHTQSGSFLRNAYYQNAAPVAGRGYLSNFKERMNPHQKIKKSYRTS